MPRIPELTTALEQLALVEKEAQPLRDEISVLSQQLAAAEERLQEKLQPARKAVADAQAFQARHLSPWDHRDDRALEHCRYIVREDGCPPDKCWDRRAWVRNMTHRDQVRRPTIDYDTFDGDRSTGVVLPGGSVEEILRFADELLRKAGWILL